MKGFFGFILSILLIVVICGGVYVWYTGEIPKLPNLESSQETESTPHGPSDIFDDHESSSDSNSGNNESSNDGELGNGGGNTTPELKELTVPTNASYITENGLTMLKGAALFLGESERPELRYTCEVSKSLYESQSENYEIGILLAPLAYFDAVNANSYTVIDWFAVFNDKNVQYLTQSSVYETAASSTGYMAKFVLTEIDYENINRKFTAVPYVKITSGFSVTYKYGVYEEGVNYRNTARSVAYVAGAALSAYSQGLEDLTPQSEAKLKRYIMESRDYAHGLAVPTYDEVYYKVKLIWNEIYGLQVGKTAQVTCYVEEDVDVLIQFKSTDTSIFTVDQSGLITAVGEGKAKLQIYIAGLYAEIDVEI